MSEDKDWETKYLYLSSDFENYKRHKEKELLNLKNDGGEETIRNLIPFFDNLILMFEHNSNDKGINVVRKSFIDSIGKIGIKLYGDIGDIFDVDRYSAIKKENMIEYKNNVVLDVHKYGIEYNGKVIRHCEVIVNILHS